MPPRGRTGGPRRRLDRRALTARRADEAGQRAQGRGPASPAGDEARRRSTEGTRRQGSALSGPQRQQAAGGASQRAQGLGADSPTGDEARRRSTAGARREGSTHSGPQLASKHSAPRERGGRQRLCSGPERASQPQAPPASERRDSALFPRASDEARRRSTAGARREGSTHSGPCARQQAS